ncbi:MAG: hypothetical protein KC613_28280, partial [Myxococcales bacterium]|nr:hypothetical protein [Myxococcales bacterium]
MRAHPIALLALLGPLPLAAQPARPVTVVVCVAGDPAPEALAARALEPGLGGARVEVVGDAHCPTAEHVGRFHVEGGRARFRLQAPGGVVLHRAVAGLTSAAQPLTELAAAGQLSTFGVQLYGLLLEA